MGSPALRRSDSGFLSASHSHSHSQSRASISRVYSNISRENTASRAHTGSDLSTIVSNNTHGVRDESSSTHDETDLRSNSVNSVAIFVADGTASTSASSASASASSASAAVGRTSSSDYDRSYQLRNSHGSVVHAEAEEILAGAAGTAGTKGKRNHPCSSDSDSTTADLRFQSSQSNSATAMSASGTTGAGPTVVLKPVNQVIPLPLRLRMSRDCCAGVAFLHCKGGIFMHFAFGHVSQFCHYRHVTTEPLS